jgi:glycosyltransferase involved in cell wall biosynthesis
MYHNIRLLAQSHSVQVISFVENDFERDLLNSLNGICESITGVLRVPDFTTHWLSTDPFLVREFSNVKMHEAIEAAFHRTKIDVLQCEYLQMAQYQQARVFSVLTIHETLSANAYSAFNVERDPRVKFKLFYRWMQMLRYEVMATRRFDRVVTMTEPDARYLRSYAPDSDIRAIPIGIDPEEFSPLPGEPDRPIEVLFVGNFRHPPNLEAARFLVNEIAPCFPSIRFVLPGNNTPPDLNGPPNVVIPGYAPDTRVLYHTPNTIVAAPLFSGTGQRVKLLEALSMACPVITTTIGALGLPVHHGCEVIVANTTQEFRNALTELASSEGLRVKLGQAGREMIRRHFDWSEIGGSLLQLVEKDVICGGHARGVSSRNPD